MKLPPMSPPFGRFSVHGLSLTNQPLGGDKSTLPLFQLARRQRLVERHKLLKCRTPGDVEHAWEEIGESQFPAEASPDRFICTGLAQRFVLPCYISPDNILQHRRHFVRLSPATIATNVHRACSHKLPAVSVPPARFRFLGSEAGIKPVGAMAMSLAIAAVCQVLCKRLFEPTVSLLSSPQFFTTSRAVWSALHRLAGSIPAFGHRFLSAAALTRNQVDLMRRDNGAANDLPGLEELGIQSRGIEGSPHDQARGLSLNLRWNLALLARLVRTEQEEYGHGKMRPVRQRL
ncbi:hypothetical protein [Mesorhizobium sp. WSM2239]|uniref:Uncharacterized protein n=2 Tax=unclassified Mesorhizobium TaxID=325217 RepID=A0AAU8DFR5_9HYPH